MINRIGVTVKVVKSVLFSLSVVLLLSLVGCGGGTQGTQTGSNVTYRGMILDSNSNAVSGAQVTYVNTARNNLSATTNEDGLFVIEAPRVNNAEFIIQKGPISNRLVLNRTIPESATVVNFVAQLNEDKDEADLILFEPGDGSSEGNTNNDPILEDSGDSSDSSGNNSSNDSSGDQSSDNDSNSNNNQGNQSGDDSGDSSGDDSGGNEICDSIGNCVDPPSGDGGGGEVKGPPTPEGGGEEDTGGEIKGSPTPEGGGQQQQGGQQEQAGDEDPPGGKGDSSDPDPILGGDDSGSDIGGSTGGLSTK